MIRQQLLPHVDNSGELEPRAKRRTMRDFITYHERMNRYLPCDYEELPGQLLPDLDFWNLSSRAPNDPPELAGDKEHPKLYWKKFFNIPLGGHPSIEHRLERAAELTQRFSPRFEILCGEGTQNDIVIRHNAGAFQKSVIDAILPAWEKEQLGPLTIVGINGKVAHEQAEDGSLGPSEVPFLQRAVRTLASSCYIDPFSLTEKEKKFIDKWSGQDAAAKVMAKLKTVPEDGPQCQSRLDELTQIGVMSPLVQDVMQALAAQYGPDGLANAHLRYTGHALFSLLPLTWGATRVFPCASLKLLLSTYSGSAESLSLHRFLLRSCDAAHHDTEWDGRTTGLRDYSKEILTDSHKSPVGPSLNINRLPTVAKTVVADDACFIWDKPPCLDSPDLDIEGVRSGKHRFIIHNSEDKKIRRLADSGDVWAVDLASSKYKALEARIIGQQYALTAARDVRQKWKGQIGGCEIRVIGAGLLGGSVADAFVRLGHPKSQILIVDDDPNVREKYHLQGIRAVSPEEVCDSPLRTVCFIATGKEFEDGESLKVLGRQAMVYNLNSKGKAFPRTLESMANQSFKLHSYAVHTDPQQKRGRPYSTGNSSTFCDMRHRIDISSGVGERDNIEITEMANLFPVNLLHEQWSDLYQATGLAALGCFLQARAMKKPGIVAMDPKLDQKIVDLVEEKGLLEPRPLLPRYGEDTGELRSDLMFFGQGSEMWVDKQWQRLPNR